MYRFGLLGEDSRTNMGRFCGSSMLGTHNCWFITGTETLHCSAILPNGGLHVRFPEAGITLNRYLLFGIKEDKSRNDGVIFLNDTNLAAFLLPGYRLNYGSNAWCLYSIVPRILLLAVHHIQDGQRDEPIRRFSRLYCRGH